MNAFKKQRFHNLTGGEERESTASQDKKCKICDANTIRYGLPRTRTVRR